MRIPLIAAAGLGLLVAALLIEWLFATLVLPRDGLGRSVGLFAFAAVLEEAMKLALYRELVARGVLGLSGFVAAIAVYAGLERALNVVPLLAGAPGPTLWPLVAINAGTAAMHLTLALLYGPLTAPRAFAAALMLHLLHNMYGLAAELSLAGPETAPALWSIAAAPWAVPLAAVLLLRAAGGWGWVGVGGGEGG